MYEHKYEASDFDLDLLNLFDRDVHGQIDRRHFLEGATTFAVGDKEAAALAWQRTVDFFKKNLG